MQAPFNFKGWIEENRHLLKPPVGNKCMIDDDFIIMIVGGPNTRKDYHYNETPEFFYQVEGDITLKIIDNGEPKDIHIKEGDVFFLPAMVPHSPQRPANTVGMVVEQRRKDTQEDGFQWYCENCGDLLYEKKFMLTDIVKQLPPIMQAFYDSEELRTCKKCGTVMEPPVKK